LKCASFLHPKAIVSSTYLKNLQGTIFKHGCCSSQAYTTQLPPNNHTLPTSISQLGPENGHFLPKTFSKTFTGSYKVRMYGAKFRVQPASCLCQSTLDLYSAMEAYLLLLPRCSRYSTPGRAACTNIRRNPQGLLQVCRLYTSSASSPL
jgi:hypothetical protein